MSKSNLLFGISPNLPCSEIPLIPAISGEIPLLLGKLQTDFLGKKDSEYLISLDSGEIPAENGKSRSTCSETRARGNLTKKGLR